MTGSKATGRSRARQVLRRRLPPVVWLTLVWVLLWGTFTPLSVAAGVLLAVLVSALFRMPPASDRLPLRPLRLLGLTGFLLYDLVASAVEVAWQVLRRGRDVRAAIVAVPLLSDSDRVAAVMANAVSLSPGNMALQIDRDNNVWYVYSLGPRDQAGVERAWSRSMDTQRRVLAALGTPDELAESERWIARHNARREGRG